MYPPSQPAGAVPGYPRRLSKSLFSDPVALRQQKFDDDEDQYSEPQDAGAIEDDDFSYGDRRGGGKMRRRKVPEAEKISHVAEDPTDAQMITMNDGSTFHPCTWPGCAKVLHCSRSHGLALNLPIGLRQGLAPQGSPPPSYGGEALCMHVEGLLMEIRAF